ncbi:MAG TPA: CBS and ACT domain-containing protein [Thermodesulfobacteriota bacterium]|nr:CBS and ACT domain-containing protein [Thermodesulfobacteriota bacterium]
MKIKYWMTKDPLTVTPETLAVEAQKVMKDNRIRRLPVVEKGKLVGIVTLRNLIEAAPSPATTLSIHELNYLILKIKVKDLMKKKVFTMSPEDSIMDAISWGTQHDVGGFPVVDGEGQLVGIITETQISRAMVQLFGNKVKEEIIILQDVDLQLGTIGKIAAVVEGLGIKVVSIFSIPRRTTDLMRVYLRIKSDKKAEAEAALMKAGYVVTE